MHGRHVAGGSTLRALAVLVLSTVTAACGTRPVPTAPVDGAAVPGQFTVTVRVYNSAQGEVATAGFTRVFPGFTPRLQINVANLGVSGVDSSRAALYEAHQDDRVGRFVASTTSGSLDVALPARSASYDLFLMSTASGLDYAALDKQRIEPLVTKRFATLRLAAPGETVLGQPTVAGSDISFRFAAEEFSRAMNPFGIQYGRIDFTTSPAGDLTAGWVAPPNCTTYQVDTAGFWVNRVYAEHAYQSCWIPQWYFANVYGGGLMVYALGKVYLGAHAEALKCSLWDCRAIYDAGWWTPEEPALLPSGKDVVRYYVLMSPRLQ